MGKKRHFDVQVEEFVKLLSNKFILFGKSKMSRTHYSFSYSKRTERFRARTAARETPPRGALKCRITYYSVGRSQSKAIDSIL